VKTGLKIASLAVALSGVCAWAQANPPAQQKIGVINMQEALVSTNDGKKAIADLRAKYGPRDQEFQKRSQDIQARQDQYKKTQATLSDEQKAKMERDIDSMTRALQRDADDEKQDRDQDEQRLLQDLGGKMLQVITKYAGDNQYTMVFDVAGQPNNILFATNAIEITRDIIALYDKSAPVSPGAPPASANPAGTQHTMTNAPAPKPPVVTPPKPPVAAPKP
jgi:outer membrane protein